MKMYQQGDVLLFDAACVPANARRLPHRRLAEGEATGHAHVASGVGVELMEGEDGTLYLSAPDGAAVSHEEHAEVSVPSGTYRVGRVREYNYEREEARVVAD